MSFRNLAWCGGRLTRLPYWMLLISLVVTFFISAFVFPAFVLIILPCCYLATCWLANRFRDAAWPAFLAIFPVGITFGSVIFYFVTRILTIGLHKQAQTLGMYAPWIIGSFFLVAGVLPSTRCAPSQNS